MSCASTCKSVLSLSWLYFTASQVVLFLSPLSFFFHFLHVFVELWNLRLDRNFRLGLFIFSFRLGLAVCVKNNCCISNFLYGPFKQFCKRYYQCPNKIKSPFFKSPLPRNPSCAVKCGNLSVRYVFLNSADLLFLSKLDLSSVQWLVFLSLQQMSLPLNSRKRSLNWSDLVTNPASTNAFFASGSFLTAVLLLTMSRLVI